MFSVGSSISLVAVPKPVASDPRNVQTCKPELAKMQTLDQLEQPQAQ